MLIRTFCLLGTLSGHALVCTGCQSTSTTRTTSAQTYASGSPDLRTVDNAGYVDPGGRTGQVSAGGASTTGRGGNGVPPPHREYPTESGTAESVESATGGAPTVRAAASADPTEFTERAARALCDRETYCGRIGKGKTFESADACMVGKRERVRGALREASCSQLRGEGVAQCLTAIRGASCGLVETQPPPACAAQALCR
jgi:hypothetical protein